MQGTAADLIKLAMIAVQDMLDRERLGRMHFDHESAEDFFSGKEPFVVTDEQHYMEYDKDPSGKVVQGKFGQQVRHPFSGVALAYKHGVPGEVLHIIATHSHEGDKVERSIESIIGSIAVPCSRTRSRAW